MVIGLQSTGEARTADVVAERGELLDDYVSGPRVRPTAFSASSGFSVSWLQVFSEFPLELLVVVPSVLSSFVLFAHVVLLCIVFPVSVALCL